MTEMTTGRGPLPVSFYANSKVQSPQADSGLLSLVVIMDTIATLRISFIYDMLNTREVTLWEVGFLICIFGKRK